MDIQKFLNASLKPRETVVEVPELGAWFGNGEATTWTVRGLSAAELCRANQAAERGLDNVRAMVAALAGDGDKAAAIRQAMGLSSEDVPADISRRIEMLSAGSVLPALGDNNRDVAVKLAETYPTVFYQLTNAITSLTGQGAEPGKS
jgi:hypothetical protein